MEIVGGDEGKEIGGKVLSVGRRRVGPSDPNECTPLNEQVGD